MPSMSTPTIVCSRCGQAAAPGTRYCAKCGEAVDPELVAELRRLYTIVRELDERVAAGQGDRTVRQLRDDFRARYLAQRSAPAATATPAPVAAAAQVSAPLAASAPSTPSALAGAPAPVVATPTVASASPPRPA